MESTTTESSGAATGGLDDKAKETIGDYVGDMVALESHIEEALDRQLKLSQDMPVAHAAIQRFHDQVKASRDAIKQYQEQTGTTAPKGIAQAGAALLGAAAGVIDKIRSEGVSKALRDDYTAFNHAAIGYTMLHATAWALGDRGTAQVAESGLRTYASMVQEINHLIAEVTIEELRKDDHQIAEPQAATHNREAVDRIWKQTNTSGGTTGATVAG